MLGGPAPKDLLQYGVQVEHQLLQLLVLGVRVLVGRHNVCDGHFSIAAGAPKSLCCRNASLLCFRGSPILQSNECPWIKKHYHCFISFSFLVLSPAPFSSVSHKNRRSRRRVLSRTSTGERIVDDDGSTGQGSRARASRFNTERILVAAHVTFRLERRTLRCTSPRRLRRLSIFATDCLQRKRTWAACNAPR